MATHASNRISRSLSYRMFINMPLMRMMKVAIMKKIDMSLVSNLDVAAARLMLMCMMLVGRTITHNNLAYRKSCLS